MRVRLALFCGSDEAEICSRTVGVWKHFAFNIIEIRLEDFVNNSQVIAKVLGDVLGIATEYFSGFALVFEACSNWRIVQCDQVTKYET